MNITEMMEKQAQAMSGDAVPEATAPVSGGQPTPEPEAAPVDTPAPEPETPVAETSPEPITPEPAAADMESESSFDPNKFLEESSDGLFKSVDDFKSSLSKVKEFDDLKAKYEAKEQENPFANDLVKKVNELYKSGKTQDQIDVYLKLNRLGDLTQLDPKEVKVQRLMLEGYKRESAERKVIRDFGLNIQVEGDDLTDDEISENKLKLEDAKEDLRISAQDDLKVLGEMIAKSEKTEDDNAQTRILKEKADKIEYSKKLQPVADHLANEFVNNKTLTFLNGKESISYQLPFEEQYAKEISEAAKSFFLETGNPVNDENVGIFKNLIKGEYYVDNLEKKILPTVFGDGYSKGYEAAKKEVENRSGLPVSGLPPVSDDANKAYRDQQRSVALGND